MDKRNIIFKIISGFCLLIFLSYFSFQTGRFSKVHKGFNQLKQEISQLLQGESFRYSVVVEDLRFPSLKYSVNSDEKFIAASLIKLPILAAALNAVAEEKISLKDKIVVKTADITGGSGKLKTEKLPKELTFRGLLKFMISISDNTATNKVVEFLGFDYLNGYFQGLGLKNTVLKRKMMDFRKRRKGIENYTSSQDIALILKEIYNKKLVNKKLSNFALELLKEQIVNDRLPRYLPEEIEVAHKTGLEKGVIHDSGIVFTPEGDYIICVLFANVKDYRKAKKTIAQISLLTYNLYQ